MELWLQHHQNNCPNEDFTHIRRRILKIKPSVGGNLDFRDDDPITLIVDASGLTISKKGDYI
ncbi:MAG TPA: hypothetical protein VLA74_01635 [Nitrososphaeraceae archaeon]|nr:hypothetical protein [Nitrososphaeraceae archaeon]